MAQLGQNSGMRVGIATMLASMSPIAASTHSSRARPASAVAASTQHPRLGMVLAYIHQHLGEPLPLRKLAAVVGLSVGRFVTVFRQTVGMTPHRYISLKRIRHAQALLRQGLSPSLAAHECGFYDQSHLCRCMKSACGMTPSEFQLTGQDTGRRKPSSLGAESFPSVP
ncbi:AraC family transcriptional regulator [Cupriavidus basilensis]|uniref:AraC family transcriptional regulator n=1 Tax=Cupriavidus basilensis TaxID=68895 RepID=UPI0007C80F19|nr:AraC family transcriptional regulator [Cupriavidus basilensis]